MGKLNVNRVLQPSPRADPGGYQAPWSGTQMPSAGEIGRSIGSVGSGLRDMLDPNWRMKEFKQRVDIEEQARLKSQKEFADHQHELNLKRQEELYQIYKKQMAEAETAAKKNALGRQLMRGIVANQALAEAQTILKTKNASEAAMNEALDGWKRTYAKRSRKLSKRTTATQEAMAYGTARGASAISRLRQGDTEAATFLKFYVGQVGPDGDTTGPAAVLPTSYADRQTGSYDDPSHGAELGSDPNMRIEGSSLAGLTKLLTEYAAQSGQPARPVVPPKPGVTAEARFQLGLYFVPVDDQSPTVVQALRAAAGLLNEEEAKVAFGKLDGTQNLVIQSALKHGATYVELASHDPDYVGRILKEAKGSPSEGSLNAMAKLLRTEGLSGTNKRVLVRLSDDLVNLAVPFNRSDRQDVDARLDEILNTLYQSKVGLIGQQETAAKIRHSYARLIAETAMTAGILGLDGQVTEILENTEHGMRGLTPEVMENILQFTKAAGVAVQMGGYGGRDMNELLGPDGPEGLVRRMYEALSASAAPELRDPETASQYLGVDPRLTKVSEVLGKFQRLQDAFTNGKITRETARGVLDETGRVMDFDIGPDGELEIRTRPDGTLTSPTRPVTGSGIRN